MVNPLLEPKNRFEEAYNFTCIGAKHLQKGGVCQDASASAVTKQYSMAVVCDGHGGTDYFRSDRGSRFAVEVFSSCIADRRFVKKFDKADSYVEVKDIVIQLIKSLILRWNEAVEKDLKKNPITEEELSNVSERARSRYEAGEKLSSIYGTTLIGFVCGRTYCFGVQIGDGKCVVANNWGQIYQPIPWDERCFLNVTTSLSDENAFEEFRLWVEYFGDKDFPVAVFLGSDGIDDSFAGEQKLHDFYRLVIKNTVDDRGMKPITDLFEYLPKLSELGSKDDMSLGILLNRSFICGCPKHWEGAGRQIYIYNSGDMDADNYERSYTHEHLIPAEVGSYKVWLGRGSERSIDVLEVTDDVVRFKYWGKEYVLTRDEKVRLEEYDRQGTYDGPWHTAEDITVFTLL